MDRTPQQRGRTLTAPLPSPHSARALPDRVLTVTIGDDEDVEWLWTTTPDGISYVNGYNIVKRPRVD